MKRKGTHKPTVEDVIEISGIETLHPGGMALTRRVAELTGMSPGKKVLDVSCGRGTHSVFYALKYGVDVTGLDISDEMLESARTKASEAGVQDKISLVKGDSQHLPFEDGEFDIVVNECAVGIPDDSQSVLNEMARVAKQGGVVIMHESTWISPPESFDRNDFAERFGTTPLEQWEWDEMMRKAGLEAIIYEGEPWSKPEMFWNIRADRVVKSPYAVTTIR